MEEPRAYHRPISVFVEEVTAIPYVKELPQDTQMTINIKGNRMNGLKLIAQISMQILKADFFAVTITGPS